MCAYVCVCVFLQLSCEKEEMSEWLDLIILMHGISYIKVTRLK